MSEWISIKDKFPPEYVFVLVHQLNEGNEPSPTSIARWEGNKWNGLGENNDETNSFWSDLFWSMEWEKITHWQPFPKPPGVKDE